MFQEKKNPLTLKAEQHRINAIRNVMGFRKSEIRADEEIQRIEQSDITFESIFRIYTTYVFKFNEINKPTDFKNPDDKEKVALSIMNEGEYPTLIMEILAHRYDDTNQKIVPSVINVEMVENAVRDFCARFGIEIDAMVDGINMSFKRPMANTAGEIKSGVRAYGLVGRSGYMTSKKQYKKAIDGTLNTTHYYGKPLPITDVNRDIVDRAMKLYFID